MGARRFEELDAWRLSDDLKKRVYALVARSRAQSDLRFCDQIRESAASAPANLSEGFGYYRHPEFARQARVAKSSLMETQNHLLDGVDREYWTTVDSEPLVKLADRAIGATVRLLQYLETTDAPGTSESPKGRPRTTFPKGRTRN